MTLIALCVAMTCHAQLSYVADKVMHSAILGANKEYTIYLPQDYDKSERRYPVLYLLHGAWGCNRDWCEQGRMKEITDMTLSSGMAVPMIIVMPDARGVDSNYGGKRMGYFNVPGWNYEDYFINELIAHIDSLYRTLPDKKHRAIAGLSMGGGGAIAYAQRHPECFGSSCSLSGCIGFASSEAARNIDVEFDKSLGRTDPTIYVNSATPEQEKSLRSVRWYVDCGDDDFQYEGNIAFYSAMRKKNIPLEYRMRDGAHTWTYWQTALPTVLQFCSIGFSDVR